MYRSNDTGVRFEYGQNSHVKIMFLIEALSIAVVLLNPKVGPCCGLYRGVLSLYRLGLPAHNMDLVTLKHLFCQHLIER
ncbi:hypothetical protein DPEC_G00335470 [Dallia pectoralis]|uniref:Uncharacterized protein n=1 Tax=Dallia pectoralis TaxID=75939 RepID=A0ACC2F704_DALPE|nr:hypothetical protein DPEC_G00335470 [Dallia pectoralis]